MKKIIIALLLFTVLFVSTPVFAQTNAEYIAYLQEQIKIILQKIVELQQQLLIVLQQEQNSSVFPVPSIIPSPTPITVFIPVYIYPSPSPEYIYISPSVVPSPSPSPTPESNITMAYMGFHRYVFKATGEDFIYTRMIVKRLDSSVRGFYAIGDFETFYLPKPAIYCSDAESFFAFVPIDCINNRGAQFWALDKKHTDERLIFPKDKKITLLPDVGNGIYGIDQTKTDDPYYVIISVTFEGATTGKIITLH